MLNVKKIRPMANYLVTTREMYEEDKVINGVLTPTRGTLKEYQKVVAVGPVVRGINVGDIVCVNPRRYAVRKYQEGSLKDGVISENPVTHYNFNVIELDHVPHLLLTDQDIDFVVEEFEEEKEEEAKPKVIVPKKKIIV